MHSIDDTHHHTAYTGEQHHEVMTKAPVGRLVARLSVAAIFTNLITSFYNLADTYFVSQLGKESTAAIGIVFSIQTIIQAIGFGFGIGAGYLAAQHLGAKRVERANVYISSAFVAALVFGLAFAACCLPNIAFILRLFGSDGTVLPHAVSYGQYIIAGAPVMCVTFVLNLVMRSCGRARLSMIGVITGAVLNVILDPLFINEYGLGLGIAGAAIATLVSQVVSMLVLLYCFFFRFRIAKIAPRYVGRDIGTYLDVVKSGLPTICRQGVSSLSTALLNNIARPYGAAVIAAMTVATRLYNVARSIVIGIGQGFQPIAGYNYGAGEYGRVRRCFWSAVAMGTAVAAGITLLFAVFAPQLVVLFLKNSIIAAPTAVDIHAYFTYCESPDIPSTSTPISPSTRNIHDKLSNMALCQSPSRKHMYIFITMPVIM